MLKGSSLVIIGLSFLCALVVVAHAQTDAKPVVISATRVPVLGGTLQIYGRNFGSDASVISVHIEDPVSEGAVECTDVQVITPNRIIGCNVASVGTGKYMHITVSITSSDQDGGVHTISNDDDNNVAFGREVPQLDSLIYSVEDKTIVVKGDNFGYDSSKVTALLAGDDYPVLSVDNNAITLRFLRKRRVDGYVVPDTSFARVTVDGQSNIANMTASRAALASEEMGNEKGANKQGTNKGTIAGLVAGGAFILVAVSVFIAAFVMKRNKRDAFKKDAKDITPSAPTKPETGRISHETGRALQFALINGQQPEPVKDDAEIQLPPFMSSGGAIMQDTVAQEKVATIPERAKVYTTEAVKAVEANNIDHSDDEHHSLEEIDLHDNVYEENDPRMSDDSSFSESSDDESERGDGMSSFSEDLSDATPTHSPAGEKRQQLQMSSEFPSTARIGRRPSRTLELAPSPPTLLSTREPLPASSLRHSMIPPDLSLDNADSDGSPLPAPRNISPAAKKGKKKAKKGMIRVPSSRLASRVSMPKNVMDSPQL